jgi:hypothetical protein
MKVISNEEAVTLLKDMLRSAADMIGVAMDHENQYSSEWQEYKGVLRDIDKVLEATEGIGE